MFVCQDVTFRYLIPVSKCVILLPHCGPKISRWDPAFVSHSASHHISAIQKGNLFFCVRLSVSHSCPSSLSPSLPLRLSLALTLTATFVSYALTPAFRRSLSLFLLFQSLTHTPNLTLAVVSVAEAHVHPHGICDLTLQEEHCLLSDRRSL